MSAARAAPAAPAAAGKKLKRSGAPVDEPAAAAFKADREEEVPRFRDSDEDSDDNMDDYDQDEDEDDDDDDESSSEEEDEKEVVPEETEKERLARAARAKAEGNARYKEKDFRGAIGLYTEAIEADPENAMYINNRAAAHLALGNWDAAIADGRACVACNPRMFKGWKRLATSLLKKGELAEARTAVTQAYLIDTQAFKDTEAMKAEIDEVEAGMTQARAQCDGKRYSEALQTVKKLQATCPGWRGLLIMTAEVMVWMKNFEQAYAITTNMLRENGNDSDAMYWRAQSLYYQGDFNKAVKNMQAVLRRDPDNKPCQQLIKKMRKLERMKGRGNDAFKARRWHEAIAAYTACLEVDPDNSIFNAKLLCNRAAANSHLGLHAKVIKDCNQAIYGDSKYAKAYIRRGEAYKTLGGEGSILQKNLQKALSDFEKAIELLPEGSAARKQVQGSLKKTKVAIKRANRKDYYKILGINENCPKEMLKKFYKKA